MTDFPSLAHETDIRGMGCSCLATMASSVSSERVLWSAGLTITKRLSRLNADIVEALQVLKCSIR